MQEDPSEFLLITASNETTRSSRLIVSIGNDGSGNLESLSRLGSGKVIPRDTRYGDNRKVIIKAV